MKRVLQHSCGVHNCFYLKHIVPTVFSIHFEIDYSYLRGAPNCHQFCSCWWWWSLASSPARRAATAAKSSLKRGSCTPTSPAGNAPSSITSPRQLTCNARPHHTTPQHNTTSHYTTQHARARAPNDCVGLRLKCRGRCWRCCWRSEALGVIVVVVLVVVVVVVAVLFFVFDCFRFLSSFNRRRCCLSFLCSFS